MPVAGSHNAPDLGAFGQPNLIELARTVRDGGAGASGAFLRLLRRVRESRRFDLAQACLLLWPDGASDEALRELILLHVEAGAASDVRPLLTRRPDAELTIRAGALLGLLDAAAAPPTARSPASIWPDESLPYAAKTSVFHVQAAIIARQRALIEKLLAHAGSAAEAG